MNTPNPPDPCEIENAIERERVRRWWADRAPVLMGLVVIGLGCLCLVMRGIG